MYQHSARSVRYSYCCGTDVEGILRLKHVSTPGDKCRVLILLWNGCGGYLEVDTCINTRREV